ncbi:lipase family protein [Streptococcus cuniculi]|uniref:Fungal lipase-type domain-containing protein n=1 Tax=Streptococcus cuniculi TaxID=1432788 RepID=A0A4Y9J8S3_9STRE|nr:hypothetical protein [Streptococcus cuniculi]MBF0778650.1 hypothetical protein [Streptococcus cuniculi]TFU97430.1 hypothetical protein E4T82_07920 [Streptococcus cuniculi]
MAVADEKYNWLSNQVYWVDKLKQNKDYSLKEGKTYPYNSKDESLGQFRVLKVADNKSNGMQAMAVAPVVNGVVDYDNITIAYAGTNFSDPNDRRTDLENVIQGREGLTADFRSIENIDSQVDTALEFAADIQKEYPQATLSTTGHSLGGYLALLVAVKKQVGFNSL